MSATSFLDELDVSATNEGFEEDDYATIRNLSRHSPSDDDAADIDEQGDYSSRMEEIFSEDGSEDMHNWEVDKAGQDTPEEDDDEAEGFLYTGKDAELPVGGYDERLKDVLDGDEVSSEDGTNGHDSDVLGAMRQVGGSHEEHEHVQLLDRAPSEVSASISSAPRSADTLSSMSSLNARERSAAEVRPFLHPGISRLRSSLPNGQQQRIVSASSLGTAHLLGRDVLSPSPSHFSSVSRTSSASNLRAAYSSSSRDEGPEAFKWTTLRTIGEHIYRKTPDKASALLGSPILGTPTVLASNGLVCIGTDTGRVFVFDFKQELKCICGSDESARSFGAVSALALSHDHTFVAVGHIHGYIQLFDISHPLVAARTVSPTSSVAVRSGRQEGHLLGSRIVALGFISGRHTAFVSADDQGLSFYHSLGKVLFMDANDCLRLLGKYPEDEPTVPPSQATDRKGSANGSVTPSANGLVTPGTSPKARRKNAATLSMGPLPLGTSEHPTDKYQLVAILTPIKLVIVGLKPTPKTWHRRHREVEDGGSGKSRWRGCLAWFPSISVSEQGTSTPRKHNSKNLPDQHVASSPMLAYSWGGTLYILRVFESRTSQTVKNEKSSKTEKLDIGKVNFEDCGLLSLPSDILALQWLNLNQIVLLTDSVLEVFEIRTSRIVESIPYNALDLISPSLAYSSAGIVAYHDSVRDIQHSVRAYKGKIFFLEYKEIRVGTLLSWADRILSYVQNGDFLNAINLARDYYLGQAKGNKNGLPDNVDELHALVGEKLSDLMVASARYAFSKDRLTDSTHVTPDNRGVDRTSLFEDLVGTCACASTALDDFDFLFEDLFQYYDEAGISKIYLRQLEPFILEGTIHFIPPQITQRLIAMHDESGDYEAAERIIWHIDPDCLDINQALTFCQKYQLYDAFIYIYNSALQDYVTPIVELIHMVRRVQHARKERVRREVRGGAAEDYNEKLVTSAYKIYPYLSNILSGLRYPSETVLSPEEALKAQTDGYSFLFHGRSSVWPAGEGGRLILTADEEGGIEPTYPYARLLLRFDSEAFLHVLDIAFEHGYLNDEANGISRQVVVKILLDIVATSGPTLSSADVTFVNIFIARNVPKYPQFIHIGPSHLQNLLIGLASDTDQSTREDRQLAAEFLLSAYTPHDHERILRLFEEARFYRILRTWYRQEKQWASLLLTYVHDPELLPGEVFRNVEETLSSASRGNANRMADDVVSALQDSVALLLQGSIPRTALLIDKHVPNMHSRVLSSFGEDEPHKQYAYLRCLLGPPPNSEDSLGYIREGGPSTSVDVGLRRLYLKLLCELEPSSVIVGLEYLPRESLGVDEIARICEDAKLYEAVVWLLNEDSAVESLSKLETFGRSLTSDIGEELLRLEGDSSVSLTLQSLMDKFGALCRMGIDICREDSEQTAEADVPLEDLWFKLLRSQIDAVQAISSSVTPQNEDTHWSPAEEQVIKSLRQLIQESFTSLVTVSSTKAVSLPRLFKRLLDSTERSHSPSGTKYAEFRNIITSTLESYRSETDLLGMSKRIIDSDFFDVYEQLTRARSRGWSPPIPRCRHCKKFVNLGSSSSKEQQSSSSSGNPVVISPNGVYHSSCFPSKKLSA